MNFNHKKFLIELAALKKEEKLGVGSFGAVYSGTWSGRGGGIEIAFKKIKLHRRFKPERHLTEFKLMLQIHFPLVLQGYGYAVSEDQKTLYIVMEKMDEDLFNLLDRKDLTLLEKVQLMLKMTQCIHFLHSSEPRIIHRDVKSKNFLCKNDGGLIKISDFGIAKSKLSTFVSSAGGKGTYLWMAPELFKSGKALYTKGSDVYALAMTFFEVLNEEPPFFVEMGEDLLNPTVSSSVYDFIKDGKRPQCLESVPKELVTFLGQCWCNDPESRLSTSAIIEWLTKYEKKLRSSTIPKTPNKMPLPNLGLSTNQQERGPSSKSHILEEMVDIKPGEMAHNCLYGLNGERIDYYKPHKLYGEIVNSGRKLDGNANCNLAWMYKCGYGVKKDKTKSDKYYKKAAEFYSMKKVDDLKPIDWTIMGGMYVYGDGFEQNRKMGVELLKKAMERGNVLAMWHLGDCYRFGRGVEKSNSEAINFFSKAAEMGLPSAMANLGFMYYNGYGVTEDKKKAFELYREAAEKGQREGMFCVGLCYEEGLGGVEKDLEEAKKWYKMAAELGDEDALEKLTT